MCSVSLTCPFLLPAKHCYPKFDPVQAVPYDTAPSQGEGVGRSSYASTIACARTQGSRARDPVPTSRGAQARARRGGPGPRGRGPSQPRAAAAGATGRPASTGTCREGAACNVHAAAPAAFPPALSVHLCQ